MAPLLMGARLASGPRATTASGERLRWDWRLLSKAALDEVFFASEFASAALVSLRDHRRLAAELRSAADLFERRGWLDDPATYHREPPPLDHIESTERRSALGAYRQISFASGYQPRPEEPGHERWLAHRANRTAHAWLLEHRDEARPWILCVPGYRMGRPLVDFTGFRARWLHREFGLNVAIPVMPLHGPRREGARTGDGFLSGDFIDTVHAQTQAVWDARRVLRWLRTQSDAPVGAYGVSLGGHTAGLLAGLEPDLACVIAGIPAADLVRLARAHVPELLLRGIELLRFPLEEMERVMRVVSALALPPRVPRQRLFLFAAAADRLTAPDQATALWQHWNRPRMAWYAGGHVSFLWESEVACLVREAFGSCGLLPPRASAAAAG